MALVSIITKKVLEQRRHLREKKKRQNETQTVTQFSVIYLHFVSLSAFKCNVIFY